MQGSPKASAGFVVEPYYEGSSSTTGLEEESLGCMEPEVQELRARLLWVVLRFRVV